MTQLSEATYSVLKKTLELFGLSEEDKKKFTDKFEQVLFMEFVAAVMKKLPDDVRKRVAKLANEAKDEKARNEIKNLLGSWLNKKELGSLFQKVSDKLFGDLIKDLYKNAAAEQKKKMEGVFKPEVLKLN